MRSSPPAFLLVLLLLARAASAQAPKAMCEEGVLRVTLGKDSEERIPEVCISPGLATSWMFDAPLRAEALELQGRERFTRVDAGTYSLLLLPSPALRGGERLRLTVRFVTGATVAFDLVVHAGRATRQVEVRWDETRITELLRRTLAEKETTLRQLMEENERLRMELERPGSLTRLHATEVLDERAVTARNLLQQLSPAASNALRLAVAVSQHGAVSVLVVLDLENAETASPWRVRGATLTGPQGESLKLQALWQRQTVGPGETQRVIIEARATDTEARATYTLTLTEDGGDRSLTFHGVTFPPLQRPRR